MGLVRSMANEMVKEIGNKTREFYEFVLPPVDMHLEDDKLHVIIDIPGFDKKDIKLSLEDNILDIQACKEAPDHSKMICNQRPNIIDKRIRLPVELGSDEQVSSAKYEEGILTVVIPIRKNGQDIQIE